MSYTVHIPQSNYPRFWQYQKNNEWINFEIYASDLIEKYYLEYLSDENNNSVTTKNGNWCYWIDFIAMKRTNIDHEKHSTRCVRRVPNTAYAK